MWALLRGAPDTPASTYSTSHEGRGLDYHDTFLTRPGRQLMWRLEQQVLIRWAQRLQPESVLDFACGTGRIAALVAEHATTARVFGVDVSPSMLEVARSQNPDVEFVKLDDGTLADALGSRSQDLVTAFRFFANAEPSLRMEVADQIVKVMKAGGHLIVNNHRNFWSTSYVLRRVRPRAAAPGARNRDIRSLFEQRGLVVRDAVSLGIMPQSDDRSYLAPWSVTERVESVNARRLARFHRLGTNTLWLFEKPR